MIPVPLYLRSSAFEIPPGRVPMEEIRRRERGRYAEQLAALTPALRTRLEAQLGVTSVAQHPGRPSELALPAVTRALERAGVQPAELGAILDYSTLPGDHPGVAALANQVQGALGADRAVPFGVSGSGCAGWLVALRVAATWLCAHGGATLLFGADCSPVVGRCSLPVSIMGDAASAAVLSVIPPRSTPRLRLLAVTTTTLGTHHALIRASGSPPRIEIDAGAFEQFVLPLHFVMCERVLTRALTEAARTRDSITHLVYPNTTALDRASVERALALPSARFPGPGPEQLGHAFANDLLINLPDPLALEPPATIAMVGVGSGFTWGAAILDVEPAA